MGVIDGEVLLCSVPEQGGSGVNKCVDFEGIARTDRVGSGQRGKRQKR